MKIIHREKQAENKKTPEKVAKGIENREKLRKQRKIEEQKNQKKTKERENRKHIEQETDIIEQKTEKNKNHKEHRNNKESNTIHRENIIRKTING